MTGPSDPSPDPQPADAPDADGPVAADAPESSAPAAPPAAAPDGEAPVATPYTGTPKKGPLPKARIVDSVDVEEEPEDGGKAYLLTLGFMVAGPAVIPRIRKSDAFTPASKAFWSMILSIYSVMMIVVLILAVLAIVRSAVSRAGAF